MNTEPVRPPIFIDSRGYLQRLNERNEYEVDHEWRFYPGADVNSHVLITTGGELYFPGDGSGFNIDGEVIVECVKLYDEDRYLFRTESLRLYHFSLEDLYVVEENIHKLLGYHNGYVIAYLRNDGSWRAIDPESDQLETLPAVRLDHDLEPIEGEEGEDLQPEINENSVIIGTTICGDEFISQLAHSSQYESDYFAPIERGGALAVACELDEKMYEENDSPYSLGIIQGQLYLVKDRVLLREDRPLYKELGPWKDIVSIEGRAYPISDDNALYSTYLANDRLMLEKVVDNF